MNLISSKKEDQRLILLVCGSNSPTLGVKTASQPNPTRAEGRARIAGGRVRGFRAARALKSRPVSLTGVQLSCVAC